MELYSQCCGCDHDHRFTYDHDYKLGVCDYCKKHCEFEEVKTNKKERSK